MMIKQGSKLNERGKMFNNFTLSNDELNVIYVPVGNAPRSYNEKYLTALMTQFDGYRVQLIAVTSKFKYGVVVDENGDISYNLL